MKSTTLKTIINHVVQAIDMSDGTLLTEIVFEGEAVYLRTNHATGETPSTGKAGSSALDWLAEHDPNNSERN